MMYISFSLCCAIKETDYTFNFIILQFSISDFFLTGTQCFWIGTHDFSQDGSQDSLAQLFATKSLGLGISPATMGMAPRYFHRKQK